MVVDSGAVCALGCRAADYGRPYMELRQVMTEHNLTREIVVTQPMQWAGVPDIGEVGALTDADRACFRELRDVLAKYNALERFGINLIHKHFDIAEDECLVETIDQARRTLTVQPVKKQDIANAIETQWRLADGSAYIVCDQQCVYNYGHANRHYYRPGAAN